jgi:cellulose synthase/poly-beta-1,6-N-acetylglucosamine synthase-like glycosyltransferase
VLTDPNGRRVRILKVENSTSKAENLNAALELVKTENVVIYDADHHPDPQSLLIASAAMTAHNCACVQGSTYLRTRPNMLAAYINAEFFVTHFVFFPAMQFVTSMGVFGGSNALWRTDALRAYQFRADMQTEDIDLSTRALLSGRVRIRFEPRCRSGELPPASFQALYRQRLRWALGWDQV